MVEIKLNEKEYNFRCNMFVISKMLQKKQLNNPDQLLGNMGHLDLVEIFYESFKAGQRKVAQPFKLTLEDFGMDISDDMDAFGLCFEQMQLSIERYSLAMGIDEKNDTGETV